MADVIKDFQKAHPTKASKEKALRGMTNAQIDKLIKASTNIQAKNFYASFKKKGK
jgi:hypothetical protein